MNTQLDFFAINEDGSYHHHADSSQMRKDSKKNTRTKISSPKQCWQKYIKNKTPDKQWSSLVRCFASTSYRKNFKAEGIS